MVNSHADITKMKDYTVISLSEQDAQERLKPLLTDANNWFHRTVREVDSDPAADDDTKAITSQYAAGLWELQNASDKTLIPANIKLAEQEAKKWMAGHTKKTSSAPGQVVATSSSKLLESIPGITDENQNLLSA